MRKRTLCDNEVVSPSGGPAVWQQTAVAAVPVTWYHLGYISLSRLACLSLISRRTSSSLVTANMPAGGWRMLHQQYWTRFPVPQLHFGLWPATEDARIKWCTLNDGRTSKCLEQNIIYQYRCYEIYCNLKVIREKCNKHCTKKWDKPIDLSVSPVSHCAGHAYTAKEKFTN